MKLAVIYMTVAALIGVAAIAIWSFFSSAIPLASPNDNDISVVASIPSPDHRYKAVIFNQSGGGALSSYCFDTVSVIPEGIADKDAWGDQLSVFNAACESLTFGKWGADVKWVSLTELQIKFDLTKGLSGIGAMTIKNHAQSGNVTVSYVPKSYVSPN